MGSETKNTHLLVFKENSYFFENLKFTDEGAVGENESDKFLTLEGDLILPIFVETRIPLVLFLESIDTKSLELLDRQIRDISKAVMDIKTTEQLNRVERMKKECLLYKHLIFEREFANPLTILYNAIIWFCTITMRRFTPYTNKSKVKIAPGIYDSGKREHIKMSVPITFSSCFVSISKEELDNVILPIIKNK